MRRILIRLLAWGAGLGIAGLAACALALQFVDREALMADAVARIEQASGLRVAITAPQGLVYWPIPGLDAGPVTIADQGGRVLATIEQVVAVPSVLALLEGDMRAGDLVLRGAEIALTDNDLDLAALTDRLMATKGPVPALHLAEAAATVRDAQGAATLEVTALNAIARYDAGSSGVHLSGTGEWQGQTIRGAVSLASAHGLRAGNRTEVTAELAIGDDSAAFRGKIQQSDAFAYPVPDGALSLTLADPAARLRMIAGVDLASALDSVSLTATITARQDRLRIVATTQANLYGRPVSLSVNASGEQDWQVTKRARMEADLRAGGLASARLTGTVVGQSIDDGDLRVVLLNPGAVMDWLGASRIVPAPAHARLAGSVSASPERIALYDGAGILDDAAWAIDASLSRGPAETGLHLGMTADKPVRLTESGAAMVSRLAAVFDDLQSRGIALQFGLSAPALEGPAFSTGQVDLLIEGDAGEVRADIRRLDILDGTIAGTVRSPLDGSSVNADLRFAELDVAALPGHGAAGRLGGTLDLTVPMGAEGIDPAQATGSGTLSFVGTLPGIDLGALAMGQPATGTAALFAADPIRVRLASGVAELDDLRITASGVSLRGGGQIRFEENRLGVVLTPDPADQVRYRVALTGTPMAPQAETVRIPPVDPVAPSGPTPAPVEPAAVEPAAEDVPDTPEQTAAISPPDPTPATAPALPPTGDPSPVPVPAPR